MGLAHQAIRFNTAEVSHRTIGANATEISVPELFDRFIKFQTKDRKLAQSSIDTCYKPLGRMLEKHLDIPANEVGKRQVEKFADVCDDTLTAGTAKARFWLLASCWDWAKDRYHVAEVNPFRGHNRRFQSTEPKHRPKPFSIDEIGKILGEFRVNKYYSYYHDYVMFLLGVGCRPGEAASLCWQRVAEDCSSVNICRSITRGQEGPTKTKRDRTVNLSPAIVSMLKARRERYQPQPNDLVFPTPNGLPINDRNFRRRAWTEVLKAARVDYRKPYTCRSTAASHALANREDYISVAKALGHSPRVLHDNYAEVIESRSVINTLEGILDGGSGGGDRE
jgi:integrase